MNCRFAEAISVAELVDAPVSDAFTRFLNRGKMLSAFLGFASASAVSSQAIKNIARTTSGKRE
jgi:hypothetical protein